MTKITFETATLADAVKKAHQVAPSKGSAFDTAAGFVMEVNPSPMPAIFRATNLEIFSMEWVDVVEVEGDAAKWRIPSALFNQVVSSLPIGTGKKVVLEEVTKGFQTQLHLTSGRTKAKFNLLDVEYYPSWDAFDPDDLFTVKDLGGRIGMVDWAASKADIPINGVHLNGKHAIATDRYRLAAAPLELSSFLEPVTIPAKILTAILRQTGEVSVGRDGNQFLIMPDEHSQIRSVIYAETYPGVSKIMERTEYAETIDVRKDPLLEMLNRASGFAMGDRIPNLKMFIGKEEIAVMMTQEEVGLLGDVLEVPGQCQHDRVTIHFTPKNLIEAVTNVPGDLLKFSYDPATMKIVYIDGGSGFQAWVMARAENAPAADG
jgi:DNA polymerase III sliding clamp (beta) subunit (PCNA family)